MRKTFALLLLLLAGSLPALPGTHTDFAAAWDVFNRTGTAADGFEIDFSPFFGPPPTAFGSTFSGGCYSFGRCSWSGESVPPGGRADIVLWVYGPFGTFIPDAHWTDASVPTGPAELPGVTLVGGAWRFFNPYDTFLFLTGNSQEVRDAQTYPPGLAYSPFGLAQPVPDLIIPPHEFFDWPIDVSHRYAVFQGEARVAPGFRVPGELSARFVYSIHQTPEPAAVWMIAAPLAAILAVNRRRSAGPS